MPTVLFRTCTIKSMGELGSTMDMTEMRTPSDQPPLPGQQASQIDTVQNVQTPRAKTRLLQSVAMAWRLCVWSVPRFCGGCWIHLGAVLPAGHNFWLRGDSSVVWGLGTGPLHGRHGLPCRPLADYRTYIICLFRQGTWGPEPVSFKHRCADRCGPSHAACATSSATQRCCGDRATAEARSRGR